MEQKLAFNQVLDESLREMIKAAKYCIDYDKKKYLEWKDAVFPGCLGFPASIILFSIADAIGGYFEKNEKNNKDNQSFTVSNGIPVAKKLEVTVDGSLKKIGKDDKHFYIFNSNYYKNQNFSSEDISILYKNYRSHLVHNLSLPSYHVIDYGNNEDKFFQKRENETGEEYYVLLVKPFFEVTKFAVNEFRKELDLVVDGSKWKDNISWKNKYLTNIPNEIIQTSWDEKDSPPPTSGAFIKFPDSF